MTIRKQVRGAQLILEGLGYDTGRTNGTLTLRQRVQSKLFNAITTLSRQVSLTSQLH